MSTQPDMMQLLVMFANHFATSRTSNAAHATEKDAQATSQSAVA